MIWTGWLALSVVCGVVVLYIGEKIDSRALPVDDDMGLMDLLAVLILLLILVLPIR